MTAPRVPAPPDPGIRPGGIRERALRALGAEIIGYIVKRGDGLSVLSWHCRLAEIWPRQAETRKTKISRIAPRI